MNSRDEKIGYLFPMAGSRAMIESIISHCTVLRGLFTFVYYLSVSGEFFHYSFKLRFSVSSLFEMPHFLYLHVKKIYLKIANYVSVDEN